jgi:hypothetical protein
MKLLANKECKKWKVLTFVNVDFMVACATENCQVLCEEVKKKLKTITVRDYPLVEALDNVLDVLRLSLGKGKFLKELQ